MVVMAQCLHAQMGYPGELTHRQAWSHPSSLHPPPAGVSSARSGLDPPAAGPLMVVSAAEWRTKTPETEPHVKENLRTLSGVVAEHIAAVNTFAEEANVSTFAADAL